MRLVSKHNNLELFVEETLIKKIGTIAIKHYPNEFGGFLIGKYSLDFKSVLITDFIIPKKYKGTPTLFQRSTDSIENLFKDIFKKNNQYYVGEWHSHPNGSTMYSQTDLNAMIEIADCPTVTIRNPILLILSINKSIVNDFTFYFYNKKKLIAYE